MNNLNVRFAALTALCFVTLFARGSSAQQPSWRVYVDSISQGTNGGQAIATDAKGNVWALFISGNVSRFDGQNWTNYGHADGLPGGHANAIISDRAGNLWMSSDSGIAEFKDDSWHSFKIEDRYTGTRTYRALAADSNGNIWVATFANIVIEQLPGATYDSTWNEFYRFDGNSWTPFTPGYKYNWPGFNAIAFASDGTLWGTGIDAIDTVHNLFTNGLWRFDGTSWQSFNIEQGTGITQQAVGNSGGMTIVMGSALQPDQNSGVWVTVGFSGSFGLSYAVYNFNGSTWDTTGLSGRRFTGLWIDPNGDKYFRSNVRNRYGNPTNSGALVIVDSHGNLDSIPDAEMPFFPFFSIQFAQDGTPWLSSGWGTGSSLGAWLETMAPASGVVPNNNSDAGIQCSIYPNPILADAAHITLSGAQSGVYRITLCNTLGVVLRTASVDIVANTPAQYDLSTSNLPSGAYLVTVANGAERVAVTLVKE